MTKECRRVAATRLESVCAPPGHPIAADHCSVGKHGGEKIFAQKRLNREIDFLEKLLKWVIWRKYDGALCPKPPYAFPTHQSMRS